ncbi:HpcH/HpaI aldolase/citrate lyase family protein [Paenarthrobacter nicotinovorans]|jgi:citrate lyase subunit beta/citryl-CoA lyase|uniref:HpcH/HpaI aldolase/citrate lyase family protein n=1 Tax=Paenarthrobacter TaxID=1742992 RepID=UPI0006F948AB|nr:CoA ester lyase [Paenarthrobacter nicotinovorans]KQQ97952.1 citrate lyase [Arthrobacter sp. Leaf145]MDI2020185.1 Citrate lyase subunit beta-like protein [Paenarthrobacter nicotinovorans]GAT88623.1 citrate lyase subunit beta [Paenarthrobacter nicotinovorans]SKB89451.1 citrate lyase subunit beta / citryl-CoA lyase [Arthrobacter sp. 31Cvi3.1E]
MHSPFTMGPALLFCPADRPERFGKAADRADAVILDFEDAVAPADKPGARDAVLKQLGAGELDPQRTIVRVNPVGTRDFELDLQALEQTPYRTVMLAKAESGEQLRALAGYSVIALCETASGIVNASAIAAEPNTVAMMWGAEDLLASLGGLSSRNDDGGYRAVALHARSTVLLAAKAAGKEAIDSVYVNIPDLAGLLTESADAVASGFGAKACIHPNQVAVVREAYAPAPEAVAQAEELLEAAAAAGSGVFQFKGKMIDGPILKHAEATLRRARR